MSTAESKKILELIKFAYIENGDAHVTPIQVEKYLDDYISLRYIKKRKPIVRIGTRIESINLILTGSFSVVRQGPIGSGISISKINCPDLIGCSQVFTDDREYYSEIIATKDCYSIDIDYKLFEEAVWQENELAVFLISFLCRRLQASLSRMDRIISHDSTDNLIIFLYHRWLESGAPTDIFKVPDTHNLIALELGISVRTLYRSINKLKDIGFITVKKGGVMLATAEQMDLIYQAYEQLMLPSIQRTSLGLNIDKFKSEEIKRRLD